MTAPISTSDFSVLVAGALCENGADRTTLHLDPDAFAVRKKDGTGKVLNSLYLGNFYKSYKNAKTAEEQKQEIDRIVNFWTSTTETFDDESFEDCKHKLRPVIRERRYYPIEDEGEEPGFAQSTIGDHLALLLCIDQEHSMSLVTNSRFEALGVSWDEALDAAMDNMLARPSTLWRVEENENNPADCIYIYESDDSYGSSILVFPNLISDLKVLGQQLVFTPAKGVVLVTGSDCIFGLQRALELFEECKSRHDYIRPEMLSLDQDLNWYHCELTDEHCLYDDFNNFRLYSNLLVYNDFFEKFRGTFEQLTAPIRVAPYEVFGTDEGRYHDEVLIKCDEVPILMPFAETILVEAGDRIFHLPAEVFSDLCAGNLQQARSYPLLYELTEPINVEQLEDLTSSTE
ncbi:MAG TPA: hypothetical protein V6C76_01500 [Drouetiella sp.]